MVHLSPSCYVQYIVYTHQEKTVIGNMTDCLLFHCSDNQQCPHLTSSHLIDCDFVVANVISTDANATRFPRRVVMLIVTTKCRPKLCSFVGLRFLYTVFDRRCNASVLTFFEICVNVTPYLFNAYSVLLVETSYG